MKNALELVAKQAEDDGLWFRAETCAEAYVQQALRDLHAEIERAAPQRASPPGWREAAALALCKRAIDDLTRCGFVTRSTAERMKKLINAPIGEHE